MQKLQANEEIVKNVNESVPCGENTRLLLFARCDREKEDWFRRFNAASMGANNDEQLHLTDIAVENDEDGFVDIADVGAAEFHSIESTEIPDEKVSKVKTTQSLSMDSVRDNNVSSDNNASDIVVEGSTSPNQSMFEGLMMTSCASRGPPDYIKFMSRYQV